MAARKNSPAPAPAPAESLLILSMKDAGYQSARAGESLAAVAAYVKGQYPDFAEKQTDEAMEGLKAGWALRYSELHPGQHYTGEWVPVEKAGPGTVQVTLAYAQSFSQQEFGKLKTTEPQRHAAIGKVREGFSNYVSDRKRVLIAAVKALAVKTRTRVQADDWKTAATKALDSFEKRCKTAAKRGDATAPSPEKYRLAVQRFWETLDK